MLPNVTSNVAEFHKQSRQVLPAKSTSIVCKAHEYCLQLPRVLQVLLASRTSMAREPCKCRSRATTNFNGDYYYLNPPGVSMLKEYANAGYLLSDSKTDSNNNLAEELRPIILYYTYK